MKKLPIGISDFKYLIDNDYYYIDKTSFIKEILDASGQVILIPRPRRFGKTLNLSTLKYFFEKNSEETSYLFKNTKIGQYQKFHEYHNQYPVIFLSLKDVKQDNWINAYEALMYVIKDEFLRHSEVILPQLSEFECKQYQAILDGTASEVVYQKSLRFLSDLLHKYYQKNVIVLIDEYDSPIHAAYNHGYYKKIINFMQDFLSSVLKDNPYLQKGILTGILRVAKESIFSDLNNLSVATILDLKFQDKFGFTQDEVKLLLNDYKVYDMHVEIQQWYNGYKFGDTTIYNPWSLISCVENGEIIKPYWVNTSSNLLIKKLLARADSTVKSKLEVLLSRKPVREKIDEAVVFQHIETQETALWSLLLFTGYLTYCKKEIVKGITYCDLVIPNEEIEIVYNDVINSIFTNTLSSETIQHLIESLTKGNIQSFGEILQEFIINSMSVFDLPSNERSDFAKASTDCGFEPGRSYHLFILGLLSILQGRYQVKSNRESGFGRYDIMLIPNHKNDLGIVIEFKKTLLEDNSDLNLAAKRALDQIKQKNYAQELRSLGVKNIKGIGIAFLGKKLFIESEALN